MRRWIALAALVLASAPALSGATPNRRGHGPRRPPPSASMGWANGGRLVNPAHLEQDQFVRYLPGRSLHYATDELVGLLRRVGRAVNRRTGARLTVGDLSAHNGGPVGHHASHQSGRDADLCFFQADARGHSVASADYVTFDRNGRALVGPLRFDVARNWALVEALVNDPAVRVEHLFIAHWLRALLLDYGRAHGADAATLARAESLMHQPVNANPHANHFHVRIACPAGDEACLEGIRPAPARRRRTARAPAARGGHGRR